MYRVRRTDRRVWLIALIFLVGITLQAMVAFAQEKPNDVQIFEVRKKLQMTSNEPIVRDYYVNAGMALGLKPGAYVNVFRKTPLADPYNQETQAHVHLPVGVMKIIYSDKTMSIGRIYTMRNAKDSPVLDGETFMVGDRVDLGSIGFEKSASDSKGESSHRAEAKSDLKSEPKAETKAVEAKVEQKSEPKVENKSDNKAEPQAQPQQRTSASVDQKPVEVIAR